MLLLRWNLEGDDGGAGGAPQQWQLLCVGTLWLTLCALIHFFLYCLKATAAVLSGLAYS